MGGRVGDSRTNYFGLMTESQRQPVPREDGGELATALAFLDFARESVLDVDPVVVVG